MRPGGDFREFEEGSYTIDPGNRAHYDLLLRFTAEVRSSLGHAPLERDRLSGKISGDEFLGYIWRRPSANCKWASRST